MSKQRARTITARQKAAFDQSKKRKKGAKPETIARKLKEEAEKLRHNRATSALVPDCGKRSRKRR